MDPNDQSYVENTQQITHANWISIIVAGLALFAMFFGAGNLIFPTMIGIESGIYLALAITGFIATGVLLPALGVVASATSRTGINGLTNRLGHYFGLFYTVLIFLSIGVLYAIPRVATVSYETSLKPILMQMGYDMHPGSYANAIALAGFTLVFFCFTAWLALSPSKLINRIGTWLTPALLALLVILIIAGWWGLPITHTLAKPDYAARPVATGLLQGYSTMDAMAAIVFGGIVIESLRRQGFSTKRKHNQISLFSATVGANLVAAVLLALVYVGLANLGVRTPAKTVDNGAQALSLVATEIFGATGLIIFGLIVILACLTTAIGLVGSSVDFFGKFFPRVPLSTMVLAHIVIALALSNLGLGVILQIVGPLTLFTYPITIALIFVCILNFAIPFQLNWAYRLPVWMAAIFGAWSSLRSLGILSFLETIWIHLPMAASDMAWVTPAFIGLIIGLLLDLTIKNPQKETLTA